MFKLVLTSITPMLIELITILIGIAVLYLMNIAKKYLNVLKEKDTIGIVDLVTDRVVEYVEAELKGEPGLIKRNYAITKAKQILYEHNIIVDEDEIIAGIENGVNKLTKLKK